MPYIYDIYLQLPAGKTDFFNDAGSPPHIGDSLVFGSSAAIEKLQSHLLAHARLLARAPGAQHEERPSGPPFVRRKRGVAAIPRGYSLLQGASGEAARLFKELMGQ